MATLGAGGLIPSKSTEVVMESEDLRISVRQIDVNYIFRNATNHDVDAIIAFPLPPLHGATIEHVPISIPSKDPVNFMAFAVSVDGRPVSPEVELRAFNDGKDITAQLTGLGLPVSVLDPQLAVAISKLGTKQRKKLETDSLIGDEEIQGGVNAKVEHHIWASWETRIQFYWSQHFPAGSTLHVSHSYRPIVGGSYIVRSDDGNFSVKPYCGGPETLAQIRDLKTKLGKKNDSGVDLLERRIQYILTTGNNWSGPIRNFHLQIVKDKPEDILTTCFPGVRRTSDTTYELSRTNFHPDSELSLLILEPYKSTTGPD